MHIRVSLVQYICKKNRQKQNSQKKETDFSIES